MNYLFFQYFDSSVSIAISNGNEISEALENAVFSHFSYNEILLMLEDLTIGIDQIMQIIDSIPKRFLKLSSDVEVDLIIQKLNYIIRRLPVNNPLIEYTIKKTIEILEVATDEKHQIYKKYYRFYVPYISALSHQKKNIKSMCDSLNALLDSTKPKIIFQVDNYCDILVKNYLCNDKFEIITNNGSCYFGLSESLIPLHMILGSSLAHGKFIIKKCESCGRHYILTRDNNKKYCCDSCRLKGEYTASYNKFPIDELPDEYQRFNKRIQYLRTKLSGYNDSLDEFMSLVDTQKKELKEIKKLVSAGKIEKSVWDERLEYSIKEINQKNFELLEEIKNSKD